MPARELGGDARAPRRRGRAPVRQCSVTLTPDSCARRARPGSRASASSAAAATASTNGSDARIDRGARRRRATPCRTDRRRRRPGTRNVLGEELDRPAAHDPDPPEPARRARRARRSRPGSATRVLGRVRRSARANRRSRTRSTVSAGLLGERVDRCVDVEHGGTLPAMDAEDRRRVKPSESNAQTLVGLSHRIHAHPELKFEEDAVERVDRGRARRRRASPSTPASATCRPRSRAGSAAARCTSRSARSTTRCPAIGHACGHNIIAATAVGAGLALAPLVDDLDLTVSVIGTPAEEGGGGKVFLLERGAFDGVHAAMMVHPAPFEDLTPRVSAVAHFGVRYTGRAVARGRRAAPRRQRGRRDHGRAGRDRTAAPAPPPRRPGARRRHARRRRAEHRARAHRGAVDGARADDRRPRSDPARASSTASKPARSRPARTLTIEDVAPDYAQMEHDHDIVEVYRANAVALGRAPDDEHEMTFSTDMGNVSLEMPSIHPCIGIETGGAVNHQPEFAAACVNASADRAVLEGALAMAWTAIDLATGPLRDAADARAERSYGRRRRRRRSRGCRRSRAAAASGYGMCSLDVRPDRTARAAPSRSRPARQYTVLPVWVCLGQSVASPLVRVALAPCSVSAMSPALPAAAPPLSTITLTALGGRPRRRGRRGAVLDGRGRLRRRRGGRGGVGRVRGRSTGRCRCGRRSGAARSR